MSSCYLLSHVWVFANRWTVVCQAPLSMDFSRQECWILQPFPSPGNLPDPGIKPGSSSLQADSFLSVPPGRECQNSSHFIYSVIGINIPVSDFNKHFKDIYNFLIVKVIWSHYIYFICKYLGCNFYILCNVIDSGYPLSWTNCLPYEGYIILSKANKI